MELKKGGENLQRCAPRRRCAKGRSANSPHSSPCDVHKNIKNKCEEGEDARLQQQRKHDGGTKEEDYRPKTEMEREKLEEATFSVAIEGMPAQMPRGSGRGVGGCANGMREALSLHVVTFLTVAHRQTSIHVCVTIHGSTWSHVR